MRNLLDSCCLENGYSTAIGSVVMVTLHPYNYGGGFKVCILLYVVVFNV